MITYADNVGASLVQLRSILASEGMRQEFSSSMPSDCDQVKSNEIINTIISEIENFLVYLADVDIDQVSGRIETKLARLGHDGISISEDSLDKIAHSILPPRDSDVNDGASGKLDKKGFLSNLFEKIKKGLKPKRGDIVEQIIYILNNINKEKKLKDFREYLQQLSKDNKKNNAESDGGITPKTLDDILPKLKFFDVLTKRINFFIDAVIAPCSTVQRIMFMASSKIFVIGQKMTGWTLRFNEIIYNLVEFLVTDMRDCLALTISRIALTTSNIILSTSRVLLLVSGIMLAVSSISLVISITTSLVSMLTSSASALVTVFTTMLTTISGIMTSVISAASTIMTSVMSLALSVGISLLVSAFTVAIAVFALAIQIFAAISAVLIGFLAVFSILGISMLILMGAMSIGLISALGVAAMSLGLAMLGIVAAAGIISVLIVGVTLVALALVFGLVLAMSYVLIVPATAIVGFMIYAALGVASFMSAALIFPVSIILAAAMLAGASIIGVAYLVGIFALAILGYALSLFGVDGTDILDQIFEFFEGTAIYEWWTKEVKPRGGLWEYLKYSMERGWAWIKNVKDIVMRSIIKAWRDTWLYRWWVDEVEASGGLWGWIKYKMDEGLMWIKDYAGNAWDNFYQKLKDKWTWLTDFFGSVKNALSQWWENSSIKKSIDSIHNWINEKLKALKEIVGKVENIGNTVNTALTGVDNDKMLEQENHAIEMANKTLKEIKEFANKCTDIDLLASKYKVFADRISAEKNPTLFTRQAANVYFCRIRDIRFEKYLDSIKKVENVNALIKNRKWYQDNLYVVAKSGRRAKIKGHEKAIAALTERIDELQNARTQDAARIDEKAKSATDSLMEKRRNQDAATSAQDQKLGDIDINGESQADEIVPVPYGISGFDKQKEWILNSGK